jgi:MoaA/NifB/PqqE/SkfB family radical SAM enzyme
VLYPFPEHIHDLDATQRSSREGPDEPFCGAGTSSLAISSSGDVLPCIIYPRAVGNVRDGSLLDIWNNYDAWRAIRGFRAREFVDCGPCGMKEACLRCPAVCLAECGRPNSRLSVFCRAADYYTRSQASNARVKGGGINAG